MLQIWNLESETPSRVTSNMGAKKEKGPMSGSWQQNEKCSSEHMPVMRYFPSSALLIVITAVAETPKGC